MAHTPTVEAIDLGKSYGDVIVLKHVSFSAKPGESIAFTSPSGSGKSTMLSMVGLLLTPTTGDVAIDGMRASTLDDERLSALRRETFGFVFQHTQLIGSLRAWENVTVPARFMGKDAPDAEKRADELLERFGLADKRDNYPFQLSVGQKRRVALARALMLDPPVLIADEPTNDLDAESADSVTRALFEHVEMGGTLLYATHDPELSARADHLMRLEGKTFVEDGGRSESDRSAAGAR
ncbi:MAG: ABC transporter ATP-binding protein [Eggerthellaceae bacterium]